MGKLISPPISFSVSFNALSVHLLTPILCRFPSPHPHTIFFVFCSLHLASHSAFSLAPYCLPSANRVSTIYFVHNQSQSLYLGLVNNLFSSLILLVLHLLPSSTVPNILFLSHLFSNSSSLFPSVHVSNPNITTA